MFPTPITGQITTSAEAIELIGKGHYPNEEEKKQAHDYIEDFATRPLPEPFYYRTQKPPGAGQFDYEIYPKKLYPETFTILQQAQFTGRPLPDGDYGFNEPTGLCIMSILADCCARTTRRRLTDRSAAYATVAGLLAEQGRDVVTVLPRTRLPRTANLNRVPLILCADVFFITAGTIDLLG